MINRGTLNHYRIKRNGLKVRALGLYMQSTESDEHKNLAVFSLNIVFYSFF